MKKYKLIVPDMIPQELISLAWGLLDFNKTTVISKDGYICNEAGSHISSKCPSDWLHEIEDELMTAADYTAHLDIQSPSSRYTFSLSEIAYILIKVQAAFNAGEANQKLRNRETASFTDEWNSIGNITNYNAYSGSDIAKMLWNACKKSHNLD